MTNTNDHTPRPTSTEMPHGHPISTYKDEFKERISAKTELQHLLGHSFRLDLLLEHDVWSYDKFIGKKVTRLQVETAVLFSPTVTFRNLSLGCTQTRIVRDLISVSPTSRRLRDLH